MPFGVRDDAGFAGQHRTVALLEVGEVVGERGECQGIRTEVHLALAVTHRERRALPRADQQVVVAVEQEGECEGALDDLQGRPHGLCRRKTVVHEVGHEMGDDLAVRLAREGVTFCAQLIAQLPKILDDAVMHDGQPGRGVRMGVVLRRPPVGRPARMADADGAVQRLLGQLGFEVPELAGRPSPGQAAVLQRRDTGRVVTAIFETLEGIDEVKRDGACSQDADDATHGASSLADGRTETGIAAANSCEQVKRCPCLFYVLSDPF